jgi:heptosyltransferase-2
VTGIAPPARLAVRLPNPAGDAVLATPALRALRRALPSTRIVWAARPAVLALLDGLPDRDETLAVEGPLDRGLLAPRRLGRRWREDGVDAVLVLPNSRSSARAAAASGAAVRVGDARRGRTRLLTHPVEAERDGRGFRAVPMREHYLRLVAPFGAVDDGRPPALATTASGEAQALARLREGGLLDRPFLAVSPGAGFGPSKVYPPPLLADAVARVRAGTGLGVVVLGGPGEEPLAADVAARLAPPVLSTHGRPALWPEAKSLLARASLLLTPDAGPRHVAAALGRPVVVVAGPTDPAWGSGDAALVTVVRREGLSCLGCHLRTCPIGHPCLSGLEPAVVAAACLDRVRTPSRDAAAALPSAG